MALLRQLRRFLAKSPIWSVSRTCRQITLQGNTRKRTGRLPKATGSASGRRVAVIETQCSIEDRIRRCPYTLHFNKVTWHYAGGILTLRGQVGTFYLKQMLQTMLQDVSHVQRLVNEVDVISAIGLSSERKC